IITQGIIVNSTAFEDADEKGQLNFVGYKAKVYPFASERKSMTTIIRLPSSSTSHSKASEHVEYRIYVKGASEIVFDGCTHFVNAEGQVQKLDDRSKQYFKDIISEYAGKTLRTICMAYRDITTSEFNHINDDNPPIHDLICLGIIGIEDPLRPGVIESVKIFKKAGVTVRMITGDNLETAKAIARNAGIYKNGVAITGPEFRKMSKEEQSQIIPRLEVLARSSPMDKTIVVS
ncbi:5635_t:CDS:2, partial [Racocetra fulgida]